MKRWLVKAFDYLLKGARLISKYRLRLVAMLTGVFISFIYALAHIIESNGYDPIIVELDRNGWLGALVGSPWFQQGAHALLSPWNLGPSSEALLGLMMALFVVLVLLLLLSRYIRLFFIPLTLLTTVIFSQVFSILKRNYYIENVVELFDRWGLKLHRNVDPYGFKDPEKIEAILKIVQDTYVYILKAQGKAFQLGDFNHQSLVKEILAKDFTSWPAIEAFIQGRLSECIKVVEVANNTDFYGWLTFIGAVVIAAVLIAGLFWLFQPGTAVPVLPPGPTHEEIVDLRLGEIEKYLEILSRWFKMHQRQIRELQQACIEKFRYPPGPPRFTMTLDTGVPATKVLMSDAGLKALEAFLTGGSIEDLATFLLDVSRDLPTDEDRFAYIKKLIDFIISGKREGPGAA